MGGFVLGVATTVVAAIFIFFGKRIWAWKRSVWTRWQEHRHPERLGPPTPEQIQAKLEADAWGDRRYRADSIWNADEGRAYLYLRRRHNDVQTFQVRVKDPAGADCQTNPTATPDRDFLSWYPDDFRGSRTPPIAGDYDVTWSVLVQTTSGPRFSEVDRDSFHVP